MEKVQNKNVIRAFVCIDFPNEIIKEVARVQELLGNWSFTGKMTELENLHLTLKFLGEIDEEKIKGVKNALNEIQFEKFKVRLGDIGIFHFRGKPNIIWIKILGKEIYELQRKVDSALAPLEFAMEERFMGHLTIARVKYVKDVKGFEAHVKSIHAKKLEFDVAGFKLMKSELKRQGPIYEVLERYEK